MKCAFGAMISLALASCAAGPHLGAATDVVITESGNNKPDDNSAKCDDFTISTREARAILNRATIVTGFEIHDYYPWSPCYVKGTASFRGNRGSWTLRKWGTGDVVLLDGVEFNIVDERTAPRRNREEM